MPQITVDNCLFDLDGTIVSTTLAAESTWRDLCSKHNVDPEELFKHSHGARSGEIIAKFFPQLDNTDNVVTIALEKKMADDYIDTVSLIPGSHDFLFSLDRLVENGKISNDVKISQRKWAIVTSGTPYLAFSWFKTILKDIPKPDTFITAIDVAKGKPDPEGYQKAFDILCANWGLDKNNSKTVVFEDAPVGIKAGKAIGAITVGITSSYDKDILFQAGADYVVSDLTQVNVIENSENGSIVLQINNPIER